MAEEPKRSQGSSDDARLKLGLPHHPKVKKLQRRLGPGGPWSFVCLILWAGQNRPDGDLRGMDSEDVELAAGWDGEPGAFVTELSSVGLIDGEEDCFQMHDWEDHQPWLSGSSARSERARKAAYAKHHGSSAKTSKKDAPSMPDACDPQDAALPDSATRMQPAESSTAPSPSPSPSPSPLPEENPLVDSGEPTGKHPKAKSAKNDTPPEFETLWSEYPQREGPNPKRDALKAYRARMREGVSPDDLIAGVLRYKSWLMRKGKVGTEFVQRASTFLGPGENWKQSFEAGGGGLTRPPEADRDAWLRLAKQAGVENRIAGKTHDQVWDMICESLAQQEVA